MRIFSDYIWPYCYIGKGIVDKLKQEFEIIDEWLGFEIHPEFPAEGMLWAERFPERDIHAMYDNLRLAGAPYGITFCDRTRTSNSRQALEAGEFARDQGKDHLFHDRIFKTFFEEGQDIGRLEVILQIGAEIGLNTGELAEALKDGRYLDRLEQVQAEARLKVIRSVPTFIINGSERIVGAQPLNKFRAFLSAVAAEGNAQQ
jgi:predicted DsbA family dithiol-disulfide isomerase